MNAGEADPGAQRGRPRDAQKDEQILGAALELLQSDGYEGMTVEGVARAAGVTRPTIYRRWPSKEELATAAIETLVTTEGDRETLDPLGQLVHELRQFQRAIGRPNGMAFIGTLLVEESRTPGLIELFRERVVAGRRARIRSAFQAAQQCGEFPGTIDADDAVNLLMGHFYASYISGDRLDDAWAEDCVGILRSALAAG